MMSRPSLQGEYQVVWSEIARASARANGERARNHGVARDFLRIIKTFDEQLCQDPLALGEKRWERGAVEGRIGILEFVAIPFRVDKLRKLVLVRDCIAHF